MNKKSRLLNLMIGWILFITLSFYIFDTCFEIYKYTQELSNQKRRYKNLVLEQQKGIIKREVKRSSDSIINIIATEEKRIYQELIEVEEKVERYLINGQLEKIYKATGKEFIKDSFLLHDMNVIIWNEDTILIDTREKEFYTLEDIKKVYNESLLDSTYIFVKRNDKEKKDIVYITKSESWHIAVLHDTEKHMTHTMEYVYEELSQVRYGEDNEGYIFVVQHDGRIAMHPDERYVGIDTNKLFDKDGEPLYTLVREAIDNPYGEGFYIYSLVDRDNSISEKVAYAIDIEKVGLIVASGLLKDNIDMGLADIEVEVNEVIMKMVKSKLLIMTIIISCYLGTLLYFKHFISIDLKKFFDFFEEAIESNSQIDVKKLRFYEFIVLGLSANKMLRKKIALEKELMEIIKYDELTEVANRRYYFDYLRNIYKHAVIEDKDFAILMVDIDDFKKVNDKYGHDVGDIVLKNFAALAKEHIRKTDFLARIGGEEFSIIVSDSSIEESIVFANRLVERVRGTVLDQKNQITITVSIGLAQYSKSRVSNEMQLLKIADEKLYIAKESGKDRVIY